jgi:hypothetical protein
VADPIEVKGYMLFDGVGTGTYTACASRINGVNGSVISEACVPSKSKKSTINNEPPGFTALNWTLAYPDMLSARCNVSGATTMWDCAFYFIAKIPDAFKVSPENTVRDYGNVPEKLLSYWCTNYIDHYIVEAQALQLYGYKLDGCTREVKIQRCMATYGAASCLATGTCK